jgi:hypothetical protein
MEGMGLRTDRTIGVRGPSEIPLEHQSLTPLAGVLTSHAPLTEDPFALAFVHPSIVPCAKMAACA